MIDFELKRVIISIAVMAIVTYLLRMIPLVAFKNQITNRFFRSFLYYIPYAVLASMTLPDILYSTGDISTAIAGLLVAVVLALFEKSLITVALASCGAVLLAQFIF